MVILHGNCNAQNYQNAHAFLKNIIPMMLIIQKKKSIGIAIQGDRFYYLFPIVQPSVSNSCPIFIKNLLAN